MKEYWMIKYEDERFTYDGDAWRETLYEYSRKNARKYNALVYKLIAHSFEMEVEE